MIYQPEAEIKALKRFRPGVLQNFGTAGKFYNVKYTLGYTNTVIQIEINVLSLFYALQPPSWEWRRINYIL